MNSWQKWVKYAGDRLCWFACWSCDGYMLEMFFQNEVGTHRIFHSIYINLSSISLGVLTTQKRFTLSTQAAWNSSYSPINPSISADVSTSGDNSFADSAMVTSHFLSTVPLMSALLLVLHRSRSPHFHIWAETNSLPLCPYSTTKPTTIATTCEENITV